MLAAAQAAAASPLEGILGGGGGVGAAGRGAPDQDAGLGMLQPPALGLLAAMMVPAERTFLAFPYNSLSWENSFGLRLPTTDWELTIVPAFLTAARPNLVHGPARRRAKENPAHKEPGGICDNCPDTEQGARR